MTRRSYRTKKTRVDPIVKLAATILPLEQCRNLAIRDVANHSDADQRASIRSGETKTVRKLTRVELLTRAGIITPDQALTCEWYALNYELGYGTVGCTANYTGAGGGGFGAGSLLARYKAQSEARENYEYAKLAIPNNLLGLFERVVIGPLDIRTLTKESRIGFARASMLLNLQIGHLLAMVA